MDLRADSLAGDNVPGQVRSYLVGGVAVPDYQLAVLGGGHQVPGVRSPVHGVHLRQSEVSFVLLGL